VRKEGGRIKEREGKKGGSKKGSSTKKRQQEKGENKEQTQHNKPSTRPYENKKRFFKKKTKEKETHKQTETTALSASRLYPHDTAKPDPAPPLAPPPQGMP
jgi:hypothetical protein